VDKQRLELPQRTQRPQRKWVKQKQRGPFGGGTFPPNILLSFEFFTLFPNAHRSSLKAALLSRH
jgi:hypothetical protein